MHSRQSKDFFLESVNAPECIINVLAHGSWSISVPTVVKMVQALMKDHQCIIWDLSTNGLCAIAYDNLDFYFKVKEPTLENPGGFASITTGTFCHDRYSPLSHGQCCTHVASLSSCTRIVSAASDRTGPFPHISVISGFPCTTLHCLIPFVFCPLFSMFTSGFILSRYFPIRPYL